MKTTVHTVLWSDKKIEVRRGIRCVSSMRKGVGVCMSMEIAPERFQRGRVSWAPISWKGSVILSLWLRAIPYLRLSTVRSVELSWKP